MAEPDHQRMQGESTGEIVVIRFSALGDLVTLEPYLRAIAHFHRQQRITLITSPLGEALYGNRFDRVVSCTPDRRQRWREAGRIAGLAGGRCDLVYDLQSNTFGHLLALRLGARRTVHLSGRFLLKLVGIKRQQRSIATLLSLAGHPPAAIGHYLAREGAEMIDLTSAIAPPAGGPRLTEVASSGCPLILIAPGASPRWLSKRWAAGRFAELAAALVEHGATVVVIGGAEERALAADVVAAAGQPVVNLCGETGVRELIGLASRADLLIGNDSGPAHLAAATGCATLTLFGPTDSRHATASHPYHGDHAALCASDVDCRPCYQPACNRQGHPCMAQLTVEQVLAAAQRLLARRRSGSGATLTPPAATP